LNKNKKNYKQSRFPILTTVANATRKLHPEMSQVMDRARNIFTSIVLQSAMLFSVPLLSINGVAKHAETNGSMLFLQTLV
jgi:hypothetical protein